MPLRRMRPVAALTLALLLAPFLVASAVAAQAVTPTKPRLAWLSATNATVQRAVAITIEAVQTISVPAPITPPDAIRAQVPPPPPPPPPPSVDDKSTWLWPADGPVTSPYGRRWGRMHEGVDIDAAYGSAVVAAHRGTVIQAGWGQSGYGRVVHIDHGNGIVTTYNHLSSIAVGAGQVIERGAVIGAVGASGSVTAAHLHYELRILGAAVDPSPWLPAGGASAAGNPG